MTEHSELPEGDAVAAADDELDAVAAADDEIQLRLKWIAVGVIAFACALLLSEVVREFAKHIGEGLARRHPYLREIEWEATTAGARGRVPPRPAPGQCVAPARALVGALATGSRLAR